MLAFLVGVFSIAGATVIIVYGTRQLLARLRAGDRKIQSFGQWVKHVLDALWGLG